MGKYDNAMNLKCSSKNEALMTLGLPLGASPEQAKKRYKELCKKYHPDQFGEYENNMQKMLFLRIQDAYNYLERTQKSTPSLQKQVRTEPRVYGKTGIKKDSAQRMKQLSKRAEEQKKALIEQQLAQNREDELKIQSAERMAEIIKMMIDVERKEMLMKENSESLESSKNKNNK